MYRKGERKYAVVVVVVLELGGVLVLGNQSREREQALTVAR